MVRRLRILAGPNGSGKTSVYQELREQFHWGIFVNADEIERRLKDDGYLDCREYAVALSDELESGISFSFETVMSHPSKLAFMEKAHQQGYRVYLYYVATQSAEINIGRVRSRTKEGGHDVPKNKIEERYVRSLQNLYPAVRHADRAYIFDNSGTHFEWLAEYDAEDDSIQLYSTNDWLQTYLLNNAEVEK